MEENFGENGTQKTSQVVVVHQEQATSRDHVLEKLKEVESLGGEGLMLRKPGSYVLTFFLCDICLYLHFLSIGPTKEDALEVS